VAVVHIFRFEGDPIAELWDIGQPAPDEIKNEKRHGLNVAMAVSRYGQYFLGLTRGTRWNSSLVQSASRCSTC